MQQKFSLNLLGWAALLCGLVLAGIFSYFAVIVVPPMTQPTPYFKDLTRQLSDSTRDASGAIDKTSVDLAVIMEYASADIRAVSIQVAFALVGGLALLVTGLLLFAVGAKDAIQIGVDNTRVKGTLTATAPGTVALTLGTILMLVGIMKPVSRSIDTLVRRTGEIGLTSSNVSVPRLRGEEEGDPSSAAGVGLHRKSQPEEGSSGN